MGMYTEFHFNAALKSSVSDSVIAILQWMVEPGARTTEPPPTPNHPLFTIRQSRWKSMLTCDSYYFDADTHSTMRFDDIAQQWYLCIRCNLKNYCREIELFCDWISPYLDKDDGDFLGFLRYEEAEKPTLIYMGAEIDQ